MKLNFNGMAFLVTELTKSEMWAIYLMGFEREMPDKVTKADLVRIIRVLCRKLDWIEMDHAEALTQKSGNKFFSSSVISEQTNDETEPLGDNSLFGSETANNDTEEDRNMCANGEVQENNSEIITEEAIANNGNFDTATNFLNQHSKNVEANMSLDVATDIPYEAKVETTGMASNLCVFQPFKCLMCNQKFSKENYLEAHVFMAHENKFSSCSDGDNLDMNEGIQEVGKKFSCSHCGKNFNHPSWLKRHERTHTGDKPFSCSQCDYKCSTSGNLKEHERIHTGEKPFSCLYCDYKCSSASYLKQHKRTHTGEKPFNCSQCNYKSSRNDHLKIHERTHTGAKPFRCSQCDFKCNRSDALNRHERTHTGDKPFRFSHFDYQCAKSSYMEKHERTHRGDKPFSTANSAI